jgi:hypothetical protein
VRLLLDAPGRGEGDLFARNAARRTPLDEARAGGHGGAIK